MISMKAARWLLVFLFWVAADLSTPLAGLPLEALDGEAEEAIHLAGRARAPQLAAARRPPVTGEARDPRRRPRPGPAVGAVAAHARPVRKVPAPVPESAPEDH
jgi:hypothetical protein